MCCEAWIPARRLSRRKVEDYERRVGLDRDQLRILDLAGYLAHPIITASAIGALAISLLRAKGIEIEEEYTPEFWRPVTLQAACEALTDSSPRWDTVIVDETQDMGENDWAL